MHDLEEYEALYEELSSFLTQRMPWSASAALGTLMEILRFKVEDADQLVEHEAKESSAIFPQVDGWLRAAMDRAALDANLENIAQVAYAGIAFGQAAERYGLNIHKLSSAIQAAEALEAKLQHQMHGLEAGNGAKKRRKEAWQKEASDWFSGTDQDRKNAELEAAFRRERPRAGAPFTGVAPYFGKLKKKNRPVIRSADVGAKTGR